MVPARNTGIIRNFPGHHWPVFLGRGVARSLAALFYYRAPETAYRVGVKHPAAAPHMTRALVGEARYSQLARRAINRLMRGIVGG